MIFIRTYKRHSRLIVVLAIPGSEGNALTLFWKNTHIFFSDAKKISLDKMTKQFFFLAPRFVSCPKIFFLPQDFFSSPRFFLVCKKKIPSVRKMFSLQEKKNLRQDKNCFVTQDFFFLALEIISMGDPFFPKFFIGQRDNYLL